MDADSGCFKKREMYTLIKSLDSKLETSSLQGGVTSY